MRCLPGCRQDASTQARGPFLPKLTIGLVLGKSSMLDLRWAKTVFRDPCTLRRVP